MIRAVLPGSNVKIVDYSAFILEQIKATGIKRTKIANISRKPNQNKTARNQARVTFKGMLSGELAVMSLN